MIEGTVCRVPVSGGRKHPSGEMLEIDTSNILFIGAGAFVGLDKIIDSRFNASSIGFNSEIKDKNNSSSLSMVITDDLIKYGFIPELVGRLPVVVTVDHLSKDDLVSILTKVKNNYIDQYKYLLKLDHIDISFSDNALSAIASNALERKTGARGLQSEIEKILIPIMFHASSIKKKNINSIVIDNDMVINSKLAVEKLLA
jgi:ATP-dependent Clp protease ATP-binding subunit ClpX